MAKTLGDLELRTEWENEGTRKRVAYQAVQDVDQQTLLELMYAYMLRHSDEGALTSSKTMQTYRQGVKLWLRYSKPEDGSQTFQLNQATEDQVAMFMASLVKDGKQNGRPYSASSRAVFLAGLRMFYRALIWAQTCSYNPAASVKRPKDKVAPELKRSSVPESDYQQLLAALEGRMQELAKARAKEGKELYAEALRDIVVLRLLRDTCLRVSEAASLEVGDLRLRPDSSDKTFIPQLIVRHGKGGYVDPVPVPNALFGAVEQWLEVRQRFAQEGERRIIVSIRAANEGQRGKGVSTETVRTYIMNSYVLAGIPKNYKGAHSFRHAGVTKILEATADIQTAANIARHKNIQTTREYDKRGMKSLYEAIQVMDT